MTPDDVQLGVLKNLWQKADIRDGVQKLVAQSVSQAAVPISVPQLMAIYNAMDALLAEDAEDTLAMPENR